jgi:hypothetical protein
MEEFPLDAALFGKPPPSTPTKSALKSKRVHRCRCAWDQECFHFRRMFQKMKDPLRSGINFETNISGTSIRQVKYREAVLKNIGRPVDNFKDLKRVMIARHHYDPRQLAIFESNRKARSIALTAVEMENVSSVPLLKDQESSEDKRGNTLYFHLPNYPKAQVELDLDKMAVEQEHLEELQRHREEQERLRVEQQKARLFHMTVADLDNLDAEIHDLKQRLAATEEDSSRKTSEISVLQHQLAVVQQIPGNPNI